jgi:polyvinyl alcohol dehydrogenase (cytochrome)
MRVRCAASLAPAFALIAAGAIAQAPDAEVVFQTQCAACHVNPPEEDIPTAEALAAFEPNAIVESLTDGNMRLQGERLTREERVAVAEFLTGRAIVERTAELSAGLCSQDAALPTLTPGAVWNGWGPDASNGRFQRDTGGLTAADVPELELKWAFGIPGATQSRSQPAVVGGRLFVASQSGAVYALDAASGCAYWSFEAQAGVRTAISVGPVRRGAAAGYAIYFADAQARAYAVDAQTGLELWSYKVDDHPAARSTGAPTLHGGRLYVPTSGVSEETAAAMPDYECCQFRGSLTALDAETGAVIWKTYTVPEPRPRGKSTSGAQLWGPAGSPIWSAPTVDPERGLIYAASGNAYADPDVGTSDAILAFSIATGEIQWVNQLTPGDVWILGCNAPPPGVPGGPAPAAAARPGDNPNCPDEVGPDFDFAASPALIESRDGRDIILVTQKSGVGYTLDPERDGKVIWEYRWGRGSPVGGVWGTTSDGEQAYFAVADQFTPAPGGLHAVSLASGERAWYRPPEAPLCGDAQGCGTAQSAALTSIPGVVFSGSADGGMRAYSTQSGEIIWTYDTNRSFDAVNGVPANGGSIDGPGPVVAGGMLYVTAGNGGFVGTPGNVLLAFGVAR